jgi:hypothetical protein
MSESVVLFESSVVYLMGVGSSLVRCQLALDFLQEPRLVLSPQWIICRAEFEGNKITNIERRCCHVARFC